MKRLFTLMMCAVSLGAAAQFPNLPYNPDENGDGLIGVVDLQGLLANYGNEFASAVLSNDSSSALLFTGVLQFPVCCQSCDELPGHWDVATFREVGPVWEEISTSVQGTWFGDQPYSPNEWQVLYWNSNLNPAYAELASTRDLDSEKRCYCAAKQLPRVEYSYCSGGAPDDITLNQCINEKLADGWYAISGFPVSRDKQGSHFYGSNVGYEALTHASFWRWAE